MDVRTGVAGDGAHDASDKVAVECAAVIGDESTVVADVFEVGGCPVREEGDAVGSAKRVTRSGSTRTQRSLRSLPTGTRSQ
jgi:hypothetical protein